MVERFRLRFPPPWKVEEIWDGFVILDCRGTRLLTIHAVERPSARKSGKGILLSREHGMTLAKAIIRMANTEGR